MVLYYTFCSWKTWNLCLGWLVQEALSLVLISIFFESCCQGSEPINSPPNSSLQGWAACAQGQCWCSTAVQLWFRLLRKELCERCEKEGPVDLFAWMLYLSSGHALGLCLSHVAAMLVPGNISVWPRSSPIEWTSWLDLRSSWHWTSLVITVTDLAAIAGPDTGPVLLTWLPGLTSDLPHHYGLVWLSRLLAESSCCQQTYSTRLPLGTVGLHHLLVRAPPVPALFPYLAPALLSVTDQCAIAGPWQLEVLLFSPFTF